MYKIRQNFTVPSLSHLRLSGYNFFILWNLGGGEYNALEVIKYVF